MGCSSSRNAAEATPVPGALQSDTSDTDPDPRAEDVPPTSVTCAASTGAMEANVSNTDGDPPVEDVPPTSESRAASMGAVQSDTIVANAEPQVLTQIELKKKALDKGVRWATGDELDDKQDTKHAAIELMSAKAKEIDLETLNGMRLGLLKKKARGKGVPQDTIDSVDCEEDPKQAIIQLILVAAQNDLETLKGMTLEELKKKALDKGVPRDTVDELDDKQNPKQAAINLILPKGDVAIPGAKSSTLRRQAFLVGAIQQEVDDALDQPNMQWALIALIRSKQGDLLHPVGFVDPVGFWEYQGDDHQFVPYTRDESLQLDTARNRRVSEFDMVVGQRKLQIRVNFQVNECGNIQRGTQKSLANMRIRNIRREASAWELVQKSRSVMEECLQEPPDVGVAKYIKLDSIKQILCHEAEPVKLLRRSFVTNFTGTEGQSKGLPRRQDLEQECVTEAFFPIEEVMTEHADPIANIFSISYCWRAWDHPDADGKQLRVIESKLTKHSSDSSAKAFFQNVGIFWDYCSLHQKDKDGHRSKKEWIQFNEALNSMDIWYMHVLITTFIVNGQWTRELGINYEDRGWTHFERSCAELIKPTNADGFQPGIAPPMIIAFEQSSRKLPLPPELFADQLGRRRFTSRGDKEQVVVLYTKACMLALREAQTISLRGINLHHHDSKQVVSVLQHCRSVSKLVLSCMIMDDAGAVAIAETLPTMHKLEALDFGENEIRDDGAKAIAEVLPKMTSLRTLRLRCNEIGDDGAKAIAEVLPRMSNLTDLSLAHCRITEIGKAALRQARDNSGKIGSTMYLDV